MNPNSRQNPTLTAALTSIVFLLPLLSTVGEPRSAAPPQHHLVPLREYYGNAATYKKTWREKLLVTPGDLGRYIHLPGDGGVEESVSLYRERKSGGLPGDCWVTATQATKSLAGFFADDPPNLDGAHKVVIRRWDTPIAADVANQLNTAWLMVLEGTASDECVGCLSTDSSTEIFSVKRSGRELVGKVPLEATKDIISFVDLASLLIDYTRVPQSKRGEVSEKLTKQSASLARRFKTLGGAR